jgi:hypothetical protein
VDWDRSHFKGDNGATGEVSWAAGDAELRFERAADRCCWHL